MIVTERRPSPRIVHLSNIVRSPNAMISKSPAKLFKGSSPQSNGKPRYDSGYRNAHDGFVGSELRLSSTKRSSRRGRAIPTKRNKPSIMRELALEARPLSVSPDYPVAISSVLKVERTTNRDAPHPPSKSGDIQPNPGVGRLVLTRTRSALEPDVVVERIPNRAIL